MPKGDGSQGIQIFLRVKPSKKPSGWIHVDEADDRALNFHVPKAEDLIVNNTRTDYRFKFNGILQEHARQEEVFDKVCNEAACGARRGRIGLAFKKEETFLVLNNFLAGVHVPHYSFVKCLCVWYSAAERPSCKARVRSSYTRNPSMFACSCCCALIGWKTSGLECVGRFQLNYLCLRADGQW